MGGRVLSVELDNGEIAEPGAEWIMPDDDVLRATIDRLGLTASEAGIDYLRRRHAAGPPSRWRNWTPEAADAHLAASAEDRSSMGGMLDAVPGDDRPGRREGSAYRGRSRTISIASPGALAGTPGV